MGKATELKNTTELVKDILTHDSDARNSDDYLYFKVCERTNAIYMQLPFWRIMINRQKYGFPSYASVARAGRRMHPELSGNSTVEAGRSLNEEEFRRYARGNV